MNKIDDLKFDEIKLLNNADLSKDPINTFEIVKQLLNFHKDNYRKNRLNLTMAIT